MRKKADTKFKRETERDLDARVWAGVVPLELTAGEPVDAPGLLSGITKPDYL